MRRKFKYAFAKKEETEGGYASVIFAGFTLIVFLVAAGISFFFGGAAESWIGALGLMAFVMAVCGFVIGIRSFHEKDKNYRFSVLGAMTNGVLGIGWLALFLIGIR